MIRLNDYFVNPAYILAFKQDGAAALTVYLASTLHQQMQSNTVEFRADSPDELHAKIEELTEAVDAGAGYPR